MSIVSFKELVKKKKKLLGSIVHIPAEEVVEIIGLCGYDMVFIDTEHVPYGVETAQRLILAAHAVDICPFARVSSVTDDWVRKLLDAGAAGIIFPNISSAEDAKLAVSLAKFAPMGTRGACPNVRASKYSLSGPEYFEQANKDTAVMLIIENIDGVNNLDEILEIPGIDAISLGPYDLSVSMDLAGQVTHPDVMEKLMIILEKAHAKNLPASMYVKDTEKAKEWFARGIDIMWYETDVSLLARIYSRDRELLEKMLE